MLGFEEKYNEYVESNPESMQSEIDSAINYAKSDLNNLQSEILGGNKKVDFKTPDSINNFYRLEGENIVFQLDEVKNYLNDVHQRLSGMKSQKFGEISKEKKFTGTILAIQIALKAMETNPQNPKKYNIGKINGEYNEITKEAIKQFQTDSKLQGIDGKPGKETIGKIVEELEILINNKKLEEIEQESIKNDVKIIIDTSISSNPFSGIYLKEDKESMVNYIINGKLNSGEDEELENQIKNLSNHIMNRKLKYLIDHSNEPLKDNIQTIKETEEENMRKFLMQHSSLLEQGNLGIKSYEYSNTSELPDGYTFGHNLTEVQKSTITNVLSGWNSPVTVEMISDSCQTAKNVPVEYLLGFMQNDSRVGTMGLGARTHNPGNVGNTGKGKKDWGTRERGVEACAENLQKRIDAYLNAKAHAEANHNGKGFNNFPTPEELATGKTKGGDKFFGIYMTSSDGPRRVAGMVKTWVNRLKNK